ncbi:MAG: zinc-dependent metalloprotease, partial [Planctomycetaceae bacterium]|nr:zinc-dependent metalloprotease [Planctomycetaceae bacterium]
MKKSRNLKSKRLSLESLENRELLSVNLFLPNVNEHEYDIASNCYLPDSEYDLAAAEIQAETTAAVAAAPFDFTETFNLHSKPDSHFTIYLDFNGHVTNNTEWNTKYNTGNNIVSSAFSIDSDYENFSNDEQERIQYIWQRVAEDFIPFDVDVTTEEPDIERLQKTTDGSDTDWGIRVVIGGNSSDWYTGNAGGVAYLGSFNWSTDTPCYIFSDNLQNGEKNIAEAVSHEVGHTLGLSHDGTNAQGDNSYYSGANGWAPIMGTAYDQNVTQWSKGEYSDANEYEDDLAIITGTITNSYTASYGGNGFSYRNDDYGNTTIDATLLTPADNDIFATGIIEQNTDVDYFKFELLSAMTVDLNIVSGTRDANLDVLANLYNSVNALLYTSNPLDTLNASFSALVLSAGIYYLSVEGTGKENVYTDYGSIGTYTITGSTAVVVIP